MNPSRALLLALVALLVAPACLQPDLLKPSQTYRSTSPGGESLLAPQTQLLGNPLLNTSAASADECSEACRNHTLCLWFNFCAEVRCVSSTVNYKRTGAKRGAALPTGCHCT